MRLRHSTCKTSPFCSKLHPETDTFGTFFQKSCESGVFDFSWSGPQFVQNIKPIRQLLCTFSSSSDLDIYHIYNIYKFQENQRAKKASLFFKHVNLRRISFRKGYGHGTYTSLHFHNKLIYVGILLEKATDTGHIRHSLKKTS